MAGRRRTTPPEGSDRRQAPCVSAAIFVSVSSPRLHARLASRAAPALAPPPPDHARPPLSSTRHLPPLGFGRRRGLKTVDFWGCKTVRPQALPQPRPRSPLSSLMATVVDCTLGPAAGPTPVTMSATLAALTPCALLARAGTFSSRREAEEHPPHDTCRAHAPPRPPRTGSTCIIPVHHPHSTHRPLMWPFHNPLTLPPPSPWWR